MRLAARLAGARAEGEGLVWMSEEIMDVISCTGLWICEGGGEESRE